MPVFNLNDPIETDVPNVLVEMNPQTPLLPGRYRFRLVVTDNDGLVSDPSEVTVIVLDDRRPTAVLEGPRATRFGQNFDLSGRNSSDPPPGRIVRYTWTLVEVS